MTAPAFDLQSALDYIHAHDTDAKQLSRRSAPTLRDLWRAELAKSGAVSLLGSRWMRIWPGDPEEEPDEA